MAVVQRLLIRRLLDHSDFLQAAIPRLPEDIEERLCPFIVQRAARLLADDVQAALSSITAPTLLVWGQRDLLVPLELGCALHRAIQGSRLVVVPDAGHNVMCERPEQFNRLVLDFLADLAE